MAERTERKFGWYLLYWEGFGHWFCTKDIIKTFWSGVYRPINCSRWKYFKNFMSAFLNGLRKETPRMIDFHVYEH